MENLHIVEEPVIPLVEKPISPRRKKPEAHHYYDQVSRNLKKTMYRGP